VRPRVGNSEGQAVKGWYLLLLACKSVIFGCSHDTTSLVGFMIRSPISNRFRDIDYSRVIIFG
jgi:hypothetical protein